MLSDETKEKIEAIEAKAKAITATEALDEMLAALTDEELKAAREQISLRLRQAEDDQRDFRRYIQLGMLNRIMDPQGQDALSRALLIEDIGRAAEASLYYNLEFMTIVEQERRKSSA